MATKFGGNYPAVSREGRRDHLMFLAAAGLAFTLLVIFVVVHSRKTSAASGPEIPDTIAQGPQAMVGTVTLYAADKYIRAGSKLSDFEFKDIYWPRNAVPEGAVRDLSELKNKFSKVDIPERTPIQRSHLTNEKKSVTLPITPGMRAVTIEVDAEAGLEGWALPGTRVDIALTYMMDGSLTSKIIVQNARVLSYAGSLEMPDERIGVGPRPRRAKLGSTVTLEVSPHDALKVQTSKNLGSLSLLMRAPEDEAATTSIEISRPDIDGDLPSHGASRRNSCNRGVMRMDGREYMIECDGTITEVRGEDP